MSSIDRSILRLLERRGETHVREISTELGAHPVTVDQRCFSLHQTAHIRSLGTGVYQLTERGTRHLESLSEGTEAEPGSDDPTPADS